MMMMMIRRRQQQPAPQRAATHSMIRRCQTRPPWPPLTTRMTSSWPRMDWARIDSWASRVMLTTIFSWVKISWECTTNRRWSYHLRHHQYQQISTTPSSRYSSLTMTLLDAHICDWLSYVVLCYMTDGSYQHRVIILLFAHKNPPPPKKVARYVLELYSWSWLHLKNCRLLLMKVFVKPFMKLFMKQFQKLFQKLFQGAVGVPETVSEIVIYGCQPLTWSVFLR